ncbi:ShlB/FhaC/HecB family hemolysin secretion/activation protein [Pigmentiphaga soli]|uniref:ShlB/FhaC/HecB family hemolysin secretion/activation protein n=1 Tax=Pigmentiphaga soli TaxID=1007095 RepID=A0ABP8H5U3_9BURK
MKSRRRIFRSRFALLPAAILAGVAPAAAHAADSPVRGNPLDSLPPIPAPRPAPPPEAVAPTPQSEALRATLARRLVPRNFDVSGVTAIDFKEVAAILEPLAGKEITVAELIAQTNRITALYREHGYALSFALIQSQDFRDGLVKVTVVEGYIGSTRVQGDAGPAAGKLGEYAARLQAERPLKRATLERYLNLMSTLPGLKIKPQLNLPRRADGSTELVLAVDRDAFRVDAGISNLGTGTHALVTATISSMTPLAEQVQLMTAVPRGGDHLEYYAASAAVPVGSDGLTVRADAFSYRAEPSSNVLEAQNLQRNVHNQRAGISVNYPFVLTNQRSLIGTAGFYASDNRDTYRSRVNGASAQIANRVRVLRAEAAYTESSVLQSRRIVAAVYKGIGGLGASQNAAGGPDLYDLDFTRYTLGVTQSLTLPAQFGVSFAALGQYSSDSLPTSEQLTFGGQRFGRGYPAGELGGDKGWGASLELNRRFATGLSYLASVQPYVAADYAKVSLNDSRFTLASDRLTSVALGLRLTDQRRYSFDVNLAKPVGDRPINSSGRPLRFNANYSFQFE